MNLLLAVLFLPLAAFLIALFIPRSTAGASRMWALISSAGIFVASVGLVAWFDPGRDGEQFAIDVPWITSPDIHFAISVNEVSELGFELHVFHVQGKVQARVVQCR